MSPLRTGLAAGLAFVCGWAVHEGLARAAVPAEATAPSAVQLEQARSEAREKASRPEAEVLITPLNVRDPSALVMDIQTGPIPECPRAEPCDCTQEKLQKTGRAAPERF
ncbi:MAG: hypothetical protein SF051_03890 [Elusimicrobiota bacterium]|nr:hypothetical protein [Elusimicrobiota bacterium]